MRVRRGRLVAVAAVVAVAAPSCALPGTVAGSREVTAVFSDVGDLVTGHSVQVADVRVGSVVDIELLDDYRAEVTMSLDDDVFVPDDSQAVLRSTSLLGEKFIELRPPDPDAPMAGHDLEDGDRIARTSAAPELEFVTQEAVELLGAVVSTDLATIIDTSATAFGGRGDRLRALVDDLSTASATFAAQTDELVRAIDALGGASATFADASTDIDQLLRTAADATGVLADTRDDAVAALQELTRLARVQNEQVLRPYLDDLDRQIGQVDAILAEVDRNQGQVVELVRWLGRFTTNFSSAVPNDFVQVFALLSPEGTR